MSDPHGKMWYKNDKGKWVSTRIPHKAAKPLKNIWEIRGDTPLDEVMDPSTKRMLFGDDPEDLKEEVEDTHEEE